MDLVLNLNAVAVNCGFVDYVAAYYAVALNNQNSFVGVAVDLYYSVVMMN